MGIEKQFGEVVKGYESVTLDALSLISKLETTASITISEKTP